MNSLRSIGINCVMSFFFFFLIKWEEHFNVSLNGLALKAGLIWTKEKNIIIGLWTLCNTIRWEKFVIIVSSRNRVTQSNKANKNLHDCSKIIVTYCSGANFFSVVCVPRSYYAISTQTIVVSMQKSILWCLFAKYSLILFFKCQ